MIRFKLFLCALLPVLAANAQKQLPKGPGRDTAQRVCSRCHRVDVIFAHAHSRREWADIVTEMKHAGAQATPSEFNRIVDYLARTFPKKSR